MLVSQPAQKEIHRPKLRKNEIYGKHGVIDQQSPTAKHHQSDLLSDKEASRYLGLADGTLSVWRSTGRYKIPFIKIGANVRYRRSALDAWLESRTHQATA